MHEVAHAPGHGPFAETAGGAHVGEIKRLLSAPRRSKAGAVPQRIDTGEHGFGLRRNQLRQIGVDKFRAHFLQEFTHRFVTTGGSDADAFLTQKLDRIST
ncbi:hypothetical protein D3C76_1048270 [compost metagenome]